MFNETESFPTDFKEKDLSGAIVEGRYVILAGQVVDGKVLPVQGSAVTYKRKYEIAQTTATAEDVITDVSIETGIDPKELHNYVARVIVRPCTGTSDSARDDDLSLALIDGSGTPMHEYYASEYAGGFMDKLPHINGVDMYLEEDFRRITIDAVDWAATETHVFQVTVVISRIGGTCKARATP